MVGDQGAGRCGAVQCVDAVLIEDAVVPTSRVELPFVELTSSDYLSVCASYYWRAKVRLSKRCSDMLHELFTLHMSPNQVELSFPFCFCPLHRSARRTLIDPPTN